MSVIIGANSAVAGGFAVDNSLRFNQPDSASLNKTFGTPTNSKKLTISFWTKFMAQSGNDHHAFSNGDSNANESLISFINSGNHNLEIKEDVSSSATYQLVTNRIFRDPSAWYHIVVAWDTTQGTAANRLKLYINGTQETSFGSATYPSLNQVIKFNTAIAQYIGKRHRDEGAFFNGHMAEVVFIDGTQYAASDFGEFDEDSGIWKPINVSGLTFGTNGTYLDFKDSANLGNDASGGTDWTENNITAIDQTTDTPTNNFATMNPLDNYWAAFTFAEGNTEIDMANTNERYVLGNMGMSSGKWYFEAKYVSQSGDTYSQVGIDTKMIASQPGQAARSYTYRGQTGASNGLKVNAGSYVSYGNSWTTGDIIGVAVDLDNLKIYFAKNGTWQNSGDPTSGASGTGAAFTIADPSLAISAGESGAYYPCVGKEDADTCVWDMNFGNPAFTGTDQADGNGYGSFEYAPPSGYLALCTKNLSEVNS